MAKWHALHATPTRKSHCQFKGGPGLKEKYHPALPCLGEFEPSSPNQKYCQNCQDVAKKWHSAQAATAAYQAEPEKYAKITRENRWKRRKAAGRPCPRLGVMVPCQYRDERGRYGEGCLKKFERKGSFQKFCPVCQKHADADRAQDYRDKHHDELLLIYRARGRRLRELAAAGRSLAQGQSQPEAPKPKRPRGLRAGILLKKIEPKITLAAYYSSKGGISLYAMALDLYPVNSGDEMENSRRSTYKLFKNHGRRIEAEKVRLATLSEADLEGEIKRANREVRRAAEQKRASAIQA